MKEINWSCFSLFQDKKKLGKLTDQGFDLRSVSGFLKCFMWFHFTILKNDFKDRRVLKMIYMKIYVFQVIYIGESLIW